MNFQTGCDRIREPHQQEHPGPFAHDQPIGTGIEWTALLPLRERLELRESNLRVLAIGSGKPTRQHHIGSTCAEFIHG